MDPSIDNNSNQYADDHSAPSPTDSYQYNSSNSSINLQNVNSPNDASSSNGASSNECNSYANLSNYYNANTYATYTMPQYYNLEKNNHLIYNHNLLANHYTGNYQTANYYNSNDVENNEKEKPSDRDTSKSDHEDTDVLTKPLLTANDKHVQAKQTNKKSSQSTDSSSYLMQPPDSESIAVAAANATANRSKRRTRTKFDKRQLDILEQAFERAHYPDVNQIICLSDMLNISTEKISVWFQNRRARFKRSKKEPTENNYTNNGHIIEKQIKSFLSKEKYDEEECEETPIKYQSSSANLSAKKNQNFEGLKSINNLENQSSFNPHSNGLLPKTSLYPINNQQNFDPYLIPNLALSQDQINRLPITTSSHDNNNLSDSSSSIASTPARSNTAISRSASPLSELKQDPASKQELNTYHNYHSGIHSQFPLPYPGMISYHQATLPPAISLTTPNGTISNPLTGQKYSTLSGGLGQIFQPFIDRSNQQETSCYASDLKTNGSNNQSNSTSPASNSTRSRSTSSSSENENKENSNTNDEYGSVNESDKQFNNYSQMFASMPSTSSHFFNHLQHQQSNQPINYNMNPLKQSCSNLPSIAQIFQPYANCGINFNQESNVYY